MPRTLNILLHQADPLVGDIDGNAEKARHTLRLAADAGAEIAVLPELFIAGYPPEDLVLRSSFVERCMQAVHTLAAHTDDTGPALLIGTPWREGEQTFNSIALLHEGRVMAVRHKHMLPNYGVFDEKRIFAAGPLPEPVTFRGFRLGLPVCEDIWTPDVAAHLKQRGAEVLIVINGSPFEVNKHGVRKQQVRQRVAETGLPVAYLNMVGGQDELVFDGGSFALNPVPGATTVRTQEQQEDERTAADIALRLPRFATAHATLKIEETAQGLRFVRGLVAERPDELQAIWQACVLGLRDYVLKNRFPGVVLGLSGGIDSAVVATMAVDALGAEKVHCVMLPYRHTSSESLQDAEQVAHLLGVRYDVISIEQPVQAFLSTLSEQFAGLPADTTEENLQSRTRGVILMALSNKHGHMLLSTGNKSEMAVGYATLYGDMNGGYNPLKDIYKTTVYRLARLRNEKRPAGCLGPEGPVIPQRIIDKPPSAELKPDQTDQDTLPPYEVLDAVLHALIEERLSVPEAARRLNVEQALVARIQNMLFMAEYKRRQAPPGVKITSTSFGRDWRYPLTHAFREQ